jgi:hypothetical protein
MPRFLLSAVLLSALVGPASAQRDTQFFSCPDTSVFGSGCAADQSVRPSPPTTPAAEAYPLFAPETLARDTPPIFARALEEPTPANIDRYLDWQEERLARMSEVQQLLKERYRLRQGRPASGKEPAP